MRVSSLPKYSKVPGEIVFPGTILRQRVKQTHFLLNGNKKSLADLCNVWFNHPSGGGVEATPLSSAVLVTFTNVACNKACELYSWEEKPCIQFECSHAQITGADEKPLGTFKFLEVSYTFLVKLKRGGVFAFQAYDFADHALAMAHQREIFGIPCSTFRIVAPKSIDANHPEFALKGDVRTVRNPANPSSADQPLFEIRRLSTSSHPQSTTFTDAYVARKAMMARFSTLGPRGAGRKKFFSEEETFHLANTMLQQASYIALRQFRGPWQGELASAKAIHTYACQRLLFRQAREVTGVFGLELVLNDLVINRYFDLRNSLGLTDLNPVLQTWETSLDFDLKPMDILWNALP